MAATSVKLTEGDLHEINTAAAQITLWFFQGLAPRPPRRGRPGGRGQVTRDEKSNWATPVSRWSSWRASTHAYLLASFLKGLSFSLFKQGAPRLTSFGIFLDCAVFPA
jgi:hypothetical protein